MVFTKLSDHLKPKEIEKHHIDDQEAKFNELKHLRDDHD